MMGPYKFYKPDRPRWTGRRYERWPRMSESVLDKERDNRGPYGHGLVTHVDADNKRVMVKFISPPDSHSYRWVLTYEGNIHWDARGGNIVRNPVYVDLNAGYEAAHCDEVITYQYYEFDDLRWSSHVGGIGAWITRSYT